jgi:environmental stress-induced protein Ves
LRGACVFEIHASDNNTLIDQSGTVFDFSGDTQLKCKLTTASAFAINLIHHPQVHVSDRVVQVNVKKMNLNDLLTFPPGLRNSGSKIFNIIYVIEGELRLDETAKDQQHSLAAGDTVMIASDSTDLGDHAQCVVDCAAKIYHGVAII